MTMIRAASIAATVLGLSAPVFAQAPAAAQGCQPITEKQVTALFDRWNASLQTLDPDKVVANYAPDGVLLATVSNQPRTTTAQIHDYFVKFLKGHPEGKIDSRVVRIGCNVAQDVGTYTFAFKDGKKVHARYTYVYEFVNGDWKIAHHHSSAMPETVAAK
ncbi:SgcJ/EcaC family oxidoreductase [Acidovorax sp. GBBC 3334]|uniref:SgcJ/EcaC family oxidoreductase n=1 Tax=Acidovorax sp. GBBC 3334 TaxID=2940496 RepID=UPI00230448A8|nr:SgcJ/EcaC family oxidoreductase [Acidovorax sp. GBBC 3334]MDA8455224.1 SgcJ/EcaC family oxidoreductase [Acidovorax sp. GBBC 3334]